MIPMALPFIVWGVALAQAQQHTPEKIALDMNVEVVSLLGHKLYRTPATGDALKKLEATLAEADKQTAAQPDNPAAHLARAQALGALWRYHDAVAAYTKVISLAPTNSEAFAHRGNIFVLLRLFGQAKNDFEQAVAIAPGDPNARVGLGMTHYLRQKFEDADKAFVEAQRLPLTPELKRIADFWQRLAQRRLGKTDLPAEAPGQVPPFSMGPYVEGLDKFLANDRPGAVAAWRKMADSPSDWPVIGHIAAEAEIAAIEGSKKMRVVTF
jgi:tetratricopeptide (TPR) repeat protein